MPYRDPRPTTPVPFAQRVSSSDVVISCSSIGEAGVAGAGTKGNIKDNKNKNDNSSMIRTSSEKFEMFSLDNLPNTRNIQFFKNPVLKGQSPPAPPKIKPRAFATESPHGNDVLSGRGKGTNSHDGNRQMRAFVADNKVEYLMPNRTKIEKARICARIVDQIRALDPPGRFLQKGLNGDDPDLWTDVGDERARRKVGQALREGGDSNNEARAAVKGNINANNNTSSSHRGSSTTPPDNTADESAAEKSAASTHTTTPPVPKSVVTTTNISSSSRSVATNKGEGGKLKPVLAAAEEALPAIVIATAPQPKKPAARPNTAKRVFTNPAKIPTNIVASGAVSSARRASVSVVAPGAGFGAVGENSAATAAAFSKQRLGSMAVGAISGSSRMLRRGGLKRGSTCSDADSRSSFSTCNTVVTSNTGCSTRSLNSRSSLVVRTGGITLGTCRNTSSNSINELCSASVVGEDAAATSYSGSNPIPPLRRGSSSRPGLLVMAAGGLNLSTSSVGCGYGSSTRSLLTGGGSRSGFSASGAASTEAPRRDSLISCGTGTSGRSSSVLSEDDVMQFQQENYKEEEATAAACQEKEQEQEQDYADCESITAMVDENAAAEDSRDCLQEQEERKGASCDDDEEVPMHTFLEKSNSLNCVQSKQNLSQSQLLMQCQMLRQSSHFNQSTNGTSHSRGGPEQEVTQLSGSPEPLEELETTQSLTFGSSMQTGGNNSLGFAVESLSEVDSAQDLTSLVESEWAGNDAGRSDGEDKNGVEAEAEGECEMTPTEEEVQLAMKILKAKKKFLMGQKRRSTATDTDSCSSANASTATSATVKVFNGHRHHTKQGSSGSTIAYPWRGQSRTSILTPVIFNGSRGCKELRSNALADAALTPASFQLQQDMIDVDVQSASKLVAAYEKHCIVHKISKAEAGVDVDIEVSTGGCANAPPILLKTCSSEEVSSAAHTFASSSAASPLDRGEFDQSARSIDTGFFSPGSSSSSLTRGASGHSSMSMHNGSMILPARSIHAGFFSSGSSSSSLTRGASGHTSNGSMLSPPPLSWAKGISDHTATSTASSFTSSGFASHARFACEKNMDGDSSLPLDDTLEADVKGNARNLKEDDNIHDPKDQGHDEGKEIDGELSLEEMVKTPENKKPYNNCKTSNNSLMSRETSATTQASSGHRMHSRRWSSTCNNSNMSVQSTSLTNLTRDSSKNFGPAAAAAAENRRESITLSSIAGANNATQKQGSGNHAQRRSSFSIDDLTLSMTSIWTDDNMMSQEWTANTTSLTGFSFGQLTTSEHLEQLDDSLDSSMHFSTVNEAPDEDATTTGSLTRSDVCNFSFSLRSLMSL
jgi:hypothetical protein